MLMLGKRVPVQTWGASSAGGWMWSGVERLAWVICLLWAQLFSSRDQQRFLQSSAQSNGALLCPPCRDVALRTPISGVCMGRMGNMPAVSLAIHSLFGIRR